MKNLIILFLIFGLFACAPQSENINDDNPTNPVGTNATKSLRYSLKVLSNEFFSLFCQKILSLYISTTESIAPNWMIVSYIFIDAVCSKSKSLDVKIKCAVEDIGKNSVIPSTIPKMIESNILILISSHKQVRMSHLSLCCLFCLWRLCV